MNDHNLKPILDLFIEDKTKAFKSYKKIKEAWTNDVYLINHCNEHYYVRIKNKKSTKSEYELFTHFYKYPYYYDPITHNLITKAIVIDFPFPTNKACLMSVKNFITQLQKLKKETISDLKAFDYLEFIKYAPNKELASYYKQLYLTIAKLEKKLVVAHNDLSYHNILINQKHKIFQVIDFEYASLNLKHWDVFNFLRDFDYENHYPMYQFFIEKYKLEENVVHAYLFLVNFYAYLWAANAYEYAKAEFLNRYAIKHLKQAKFHLQMYLKLPSLEDSNELV
ncbi:phosphotransferase [Ureaplasma diversum]|uniref:Choline kinase n=1 Tax=Ureaplasma diversum NCTC 246 TaxID=1188241 RepID=A0A084EWT2_9BACT|nr:phosphotransferase [Ureaplasma diversum]KEZ22424.1 Hypothetical protein, putative APH/ChoK family protein [Ureaplasma diversum NCTC 246]